MTPESQEEFAQQLRQYSVASDCPVFDNMFEYCQMYTGGSVGGAVRLNHGMADTVVNWWVGGGSYALRSGGAPHSQSHGRSVRREHGGAGHPPHVAGVVCSRQGQLRPPSQTL